MDITPQPSYYLSPIKDSARQSNQLLIGFMSGIGFCLFFAVAWVVISFQYGIELRNPLVVYKTVDLPGLVVSPSNSSQSAEIMAQLRQIEATKTATPSAQK